MHEAPRGVWATMLTPFREDGAIDYNGLERLIEWYIEHRVAGLFAVCKSSESAHMTRDERVSVARFVVKHTRGRVPVIAGGNLSDTLPEQAREMQTLAEAGVDAVVVLSSKVVDQGANDRQWRASMERLLKLVPEDTQLGVYESPSPYHRIVGRESLAWCRETGRFRFLKDTSCSATAISEKLETVRGSSLRVFNAHTQTLLHSLRLGAAGYSSVMANVNPSLYDWLIRNYAAEPDRAERLQWFLSVADAATVARCYPASAKYFLTLEGVPISLFTRTSTRFPVDDTMKRTMDQLWRLNQEYLNAYGC